MEVMELVFKMLEDYAICDGPVAAAARARGEALPEALCFALLDSEDVLMSAASIVALGYVGWIVHSQLREKLEAPGVGLRRRRAARLHHVAVDRAAAAAGAVRDDGDTRLEECSFC